MDAGADEGVEADADAVVDADADEDVEGDADGDVEGDADEVAEMRCVDGELLSALSVAAPRSAISVRK